MPLIKEIKKKKIFTFNVNTGVHHCYDYEKSLPALNKLLERKEVLCEFGHPILKDLDKYYPGIIQIDKDNPDLLKYRHLIIDAEMVCGKLSNFVVEDSVGLDDEVSKCIFADFQVIGPWGEHCFDPDKHAISYRLISGEGFVNGFITWDVIANLNHKRV